MNKKILVVAAHPDDEVLGCGGTIARHVDEGNEVYIVFMSDGVSSRNYRKEILDEKDKRKKSAIESCKVIGTQQPIFFDFPDNQMDTCSILEITQKLERIIGKIRPQIVYTHHNKDLNIDHQLTHQAVMTACRPYPGSLVSEIYSFEVLSSTEWCLSTSENMFTPNMFVDVDTVWERKISALHCYNSELRDFPHARSYKNIEALAVYRGASVGIKYAEAFQLIRRIK